MLCTDRVQNLLPYEHTRFKLRTLPGVPGSDYINANYIDGCVRAVPCVPSRQDAADAHAVSTTRSHLPERPRAHAPRLW